MDDRELKKLSRQDLLEMLVELSRENEKLKQQLDAANKELESKRIRLSEAGNIAEAAMRVNQVFETAQAAASQYLANIRLMEIQKQKELERLKAHNSGKDEKQ